MGDDLDEREDTTTSSGGLSRLPVPGHGGVIERIEQARVFEALFQHTTKPEQLGRYAVLGPLGQGGMGIVLKAFDRSLDRAVALKVLHEDLGERHTARLRREARALAKLSHPNVVQVYEVGEIEGQTFVAMELVEGQTLREWMNTQPRPGWRDCVAMFIQLGAGLAAAHQQGLVHRDFKPGNAIIDTKGRPRVLDFGLARELDAPDEESTDAERTTDKAVDPEGSLTRTGAVMGTPAYMPPEQMSGREADDRSDQFSFCVALYEALYGERPFEGSSLMALMMSMTTGQMRPVPKGSPVPSKLRSVLCRGLAFDPQQRWPSMEALLEPLSAVLAPRTRRFMALGVTVGLLGIGVGLGMERYAEVMNRCTGAAAQLDGIWGDAVRLPVRTAILGTERPHAANTWERVERHLDDYAAAWIAAHTEACEATSVRNEQSVEVLDLRMSCLGERRTKLRAAVGLLREADAQVVDKAVEVVTGLPRLTRCDDVEALRAEVPPPEDPAIAEQAERLGQRLAEIQVLTTAGKYELVLLQLEELAGPAEALGYPPLWAEVLMERAEARFARGEYDEAEHDTRAAHLLALEHGHEQVEFRAMTFMTDLVGTVRADPKRGMQWADMAIALAKRRANDSDLAASLSAMGSLLEIQGKYDAAREHYERALQLSEGHAGADDPSTAYVLGNLGSLAEAEGQYEQSWQYHTRALEIWRRALGPDHPDVAMGLNNLAGTAYRQGKYEQAERYFVQALELQERTIGSEHPDVATTLNNLGAVLYGRGQYEQAERYYARVLEIERRILTSDHPGIASSLNNLGLVLSGQGKYAQAERVLLEAVSIVERSQGDEHPSLADKLNALGLVLSQQNRYEEAARVHTRAVRVHEKSRDDEHPMLGAILNNLGYDLLRQGDHAQAEHHLARALEIWERALGVEHPRVASCLINLSEVSTALAEYAQAHDHAERALTILEAAFDGDHPEAVEARIRLADNALARGQPEVARPYAEQAVAQLEASTSTPRPLALARFLLAQSLWPTPEQRPRARRLAQKARDAYTGEEPGASEAQARIDAWLRRVGSGAGRG